MRLLSTVAALKHCVMAKLASAVAQSEIVKVFSNLGASMSLHAQSCMYMGVHQATLWHAGESTVFSPNSIGALAAAVTDAAKDAAAEATQAAGTVK